MSDSTGTGVSRRSALKALGTAAAVTPIIGQQATAGPPRRNS